MSEQPVARMVQINRGVEPAEQVHAPRRGPEHEALAAWVGRWVNQGHTINDDGGLGLPITTSDIYEWAPGGFFVVHSAYGRVGDMGAGGVEIIGYDDAAGGYRSHLYDSFGNVVVSRLTADGDTWIYHGDTTRATVVFSDRHHVQTVLHERTADGGTTWVPSMRVMLHKID